MKSPSPTTYMPGSEIDEDLTVVRHLGTGAKVEVYLCQSRVLGRLIACKSLMPAYWSDERAIDAIAWEGDSLITIRHPNVVKGYGFQLDNPPRIVMEYLTGQTVASAFLRGNETAFGVGDFVRAATQVASALEGVHGAGILHLDVNPWNLMYLDNDVTVFDLSVAERYVPGHPVHSDAGTARYMAPEQVCGGEVGYETDVFGLGSVFYQLLSLGQLPYRVSGPDQIRGARFSPPLHPSDINGTIPRAVGDIAMKAVAPAPADRYPTARAFRKALEMATLHARI